MTTQNYCMVNEATNVCDNVCVWDGNSQTWMPPAGYLMLVQADIPAKVWAKDPNGPDYILVVRDGAGDIGFTWDGTYLTTNEPQPQPITPAADQPTTSGAQTL